MVITPQGRLGNKVVERKTVKTSVLAILLLQLALAGCAIRGVGGSNANQRGERLAMERGKLGETKDPVARTKSYLLIADLLLSFAADAARDQAHDDVRNLLSQYVQTVQTARETLVNSEVPPAPRPQSYPDLEGALRRQVGCPSGPAGKSGASDHESVDQAIRVASSIREELSNRLSRASG